MLLNFLRDHNYKVTKNINTNLIGVMWVVSCSVATFGFETATLATVQAMSPYERRFGELNEQTGKFQLSAERLAYLNSFPLILYAVGVIVASLITERWGRRMVILGMNSICIAGILVSLFAKNYVQVLVGRMIIQMHVGMEGYLIPMYTAEIVPAAIRGSMVAMYAFNHTFAGFIASIITNFTGQLDNDKSWQIPIGCILIFPGLVLITSFLVPESPRWLIRKGRFEDAVKVIYYLRGSDKNYPAEEEARLIQEINQTAVTQGKWKELFQGTNTRRTLIGLMAAASTQLTGQSFASNYGTVFLKELGAMDPFTATMIKRAGLVIACIFVITMIERIGRRRMCIWIGTMSAISLMLIGGLGTVTPKRDSTQDGILAMTIIFPCLYMASFGSTTHIIKSELPHTSLRDKSIMLHWSVANICNFLATFTLPYLLRPSHAGLGPKVGFVYGGTTTLFVILAFFFTPEMSSRSLEEIDEMMEARVPAWRTEKWVSTGAAARVTAIDGGQGYEASAKELDIERVEKVDVTQPIDK